MSEQKVIGLDIETTGLDPAQHALIQIGVYDGSTNEMFVSDTKPDTPYVLDPQAMKVNGFTQERIDSAPPIAEVDARLATWLVRRGVKVANLHVTGFNVGTFDMRFVERYLPKSFAMLSYRTADLNSIMFHLCDRYRIEFFRLKKMMKERVALVFASETKWHDAGFDAKAAWHIYWMLVYERF